MAKSNGASQDGSRPEDKSKGKEVKPLLKAKGLEAALKLKDATSNAKDAAPNAKETNPKSKEANPKATDLLISQLGSKKDPPPAKA